MKRFIFNLFEISILSYFIIYIIYYWTVILYIYYYMFIIIYLLINYLVKVFSKTKIFSYNIKLYVKICCYYNKRITITGSS